MSTTRGPLEYYSQINKSLSEQAKHFATPQGLAILQILLASYAGLLAPSLPPEANKWVAHPAAKILILSLILWTGNKDPALSMAISVAFLAILHLIGARDQTEHFEGPHTAVIPGCLNFTVYDLIESFNDNMDELFRAMVIAKVPGNVQLSDDMAGLIATYLVNAGYKLKNGPCVAPQ